MGLNDIFDDDNDDDDDNDGQNLDIIPVITKTDLPHSNVERCKQQIVEIMKARETDILCCSAKQGTVCYSFHCISNEDRELMTSLIKL